MLKKLLSPIACFAIVLIYLLVLRIQYSYLAVIMTLVEFAYLHPLFAVWYSKNVLRDSSHKFLYVLYYSAVVALAGLVHNVTYVYVLLIFVFNLAWALTGLIRIPDNGQWGTTLNKIGFPIVSFFLALIGHILLILGIHGYLSYGILLIGFFHLIPVLMTVYSKMILRSASHKVLYTLYHSLMITIAYLLFYWMELETYLFALVLFIWCEFWALLGLIQKPVKS